MTLLLAGGVTVGRREDRDRPVLPGPRSARGDRGSCGAVRLRRAPRPTRRGGSSPEGDGGARTSRRSRRLVVPTPTVEPTVEPAVETPPETSPEPSPTEPPGATPPPAPAWSFGLTSSTDSVESCACPADAELVGSQVELREDGFTFSQAIRGGVRDAAGDLTWPFSLQQWGEIAGTEGSLGFKLTISSLAGDFLYSGTSVLAESTISDDGAIEYRFEGTFDLTHPKDPVPGCRRGGSSARRSGSGPTGRSTAARSRSTTSQPDPSPEQPFRSPRRFLSYGSAKGAPDSGLKGGMTPRREEAEAGAGKGGEWC